MTRDVNFISNTQAFSLKVISLKLFLDMVTSPPSDKFVTRAA